jgi:HlyD family secretion protein
MSDAPLAAPAAPRAATPAAPRRATKPKAKSRGWGKWVVILAVLAAIGGGGAYAYKSYQTAEAAATQPTVKTTAVTVGDVAKHIESSGKVVSNLDVDIKCRASGEIVKLPYDISDKVKAGDLLCQLDPTDMQLTVRLAEATVAQATARLAQAKANLAQAEQALITTRSRNESTLASAKVRSANAKLKADRQKQLIEQQLGSQEEYETAQTDAASALADQRAAEVAIEELKQQEIALDSKRQDVALAEAQLSADQISLDTQKQNLGYTTVLAPMDGVISAMTVQKGVIVASGTSNVSGGTTILTLSDLSHVFVTATVDESDIGGVQVGQRANISVDSFPTRKFKGKVVRVAVKGVNASNVVTFEVKVEVLDDKKDLLKPEMTGNVTIVQDERKGVLTLPPDAVTRQGERGAFVTIAGTNEKRQVKLGLAGAEAIEIVDGVKEGESVVITGDDSASKFKAGGMGGPGGGGGGGQRRGPPRIL